MSARRKAKTSLLGSFAGISALALIASPASGAMVTFDALPLSTNMTRFTDQASGITFSDPIGTAGNIFALNQTVWNASIPNLTPGIVLTSNSFPGIFIDYDFGFTMTFAQPTTQLSMDMVYAVNPMLGGSIQLQGYDSDGNLLASQAPTFTDFGINEYDFTLTSATGMSRVTVTPSAIADGFGHFSYQAAALPIPEPGALPLIATGGVLIFRRTKKRRDFARNV